MTDNLIIAALFVILAATVLFGGSLMRALAHKANHGHFPKYREYGQGEYNFDKFDENCERCL